MLLRAARSVLCVVDVQERLLPAIAGGAAVVENARRLMAGAARLGVPVLVSEQYPKGLGPTVAALKSAADAAPVEKNSFSCMAEPAWAAAFGALGRDQAVICGIEAHICVLQTAIELKEKGCAVFVVADAVSSREFANRDAALARLERAGVERVTTEMVLFEWLERAGAAAFKDIAALVK